MLKSFGAFFLGGLAGLLLAASPWRPPAAGLDPSWWLAVEHAYLEGLVFGRDFNFTSGPLSFVYTQLFHPETYGWVLLATLYSALVYAGAVWTSANRRYAAILVVWLATWAAPLDRDALFLSLPLIIFCLLVTQSAPALLVPVLVSGLAIPSLGKFSFFLLTAPLLILADIHLATRTARIPYATVLYGLSFVGLYRIAGQPIGTLPQYLAGSTDVAFGYAQTMSNFEWTSQQLVLILMAISVLASAEFLLRGVAISTAAPLLLGFAYFGFTVFKLANVRSGHQQIMWNSLAAASFALILLPSNSVRNAKIAATLAVIWISACFVPTQSFNYQESIGKARAAALTAAASDSLEWLDPKAKLARMEKQRHAIEASLAMRTPDGLTGTVASWPWEFSELLAAGLRFVPAPPLQGYSNHTPALREATRRFFSADGRPEHLFFQLSALDGRYPTIELGPALIPILAGYDVVRPRSRLLGSPAELRRRLNPRAFDLRAIEQKVALMDQWVEMPSVSNGGLVVTIRPAERLAGSLLTLLYKQEALELDLRFVSGATVTSRIFPNLTSDGFLVVPPRMTDTQLFTESATGLDIGRSDPLVSLRVRSGRMGAVRFSPDYALSLATITMTGAAEHPMLIDAPPKDIMEALIAGRIIASPEVRLIGDRLLAHAPTRIIAVMPLRGRLTGEIGFFDGAWKEGSPRPVTFSVSSMASAGRRLLFERTLDPAAKPEDRGSQTFSIDLTQTYTADEPVELMFETGPETPWGWTYWAKLRIEP